MPLASSRSRGTKGAPLKVVVSTIGRFHSFDLARILYDSGNLIKIYSGYPRFKLKNERIDPALIETIPWLQTPWQALMRYGWFARSSVARELQWRAHVLHDRLVSSRLPDCDLVVALSGCGLLTGTKVQDLGGRYVCDRGSTHIEVQEQILKTEHELLGLPYKGIDPRVIDREKSEYEAADLITVPSNFVLRSFIEMGVPRDKLCLAPYGVDLGAFSSRAPRVNRFRILFVGRLSAQKGLHYLLQAVQQANVNAELVLVGGMAPESTTILNRFPVKNVRMMGHISRAEVAEEMSRASVMVLPSVQDGFGLVIPQALACGCPVIASENTGARDFYSDGLEGFIVPARDIDALADRLTKLYEQPHLRNSMSAAATDLVRSIGGWERYGRILTTAYAKLLSHPPPADK